MKGNTKKIILLLSIIIVIGAVIKVNYEAERAKEYKKRRPKEYVSAESRPLGDLVDYVNNSERLTVIFNTIDDDYYFDIEGNCYLYEEWSIVGRCNGKIEKIAFERSGNGFIYDKNSNECLLSVLYTNGIPFVLSYYTDEGVFDSRGARAEGYEDLYKKDEISVYSNDCKYYPYDVWKNTCDSEEDLDVGERIFQEYQYVLSSIGMTEDEIFVYLSWLIMDIRGK